MEVGSLHRQIIQMAYLRCGARTALSVIFDVLCLPGLTAYKLTEKASMRSNARISLTGYRKEPRIKES